MIQRCKNICKLLSILILFYACSREEAVPVTTDFRIEVISEDYSVPVQVVIFNNSEGAEEYEWDFEGGSPASSLRRNPGTVTYNKKGNYTIKLVARNRDGSEGEKEIQLDLDAALIIDFKAEIQKDNFSPVQVQITNTTTGANSYEWSFEGGEPAISSDKDPGTIVFSEPGDHKIELRVGNGRESYTRDTVITVAPNIIADFDWEVDFQDLDLEIPVKLTMNNKSTSATSYTWDFNGGNPQNSTEDNPEVVFTTPGIKLLKLTASNGKESQTITKQITLLADTNIKVFEDIQFGINTAHKNDEIGSFFDAFNEKIYTKSELIPEVIPTVDIGFYGLDSNFGFNRFVSPDDLEATPFIALEGAKKTKVINSLEKCECGTSLSVSQFDTMTSDNLLKNLIIEQTDAGFQPFDDEILPRILLFETADGRKGAIKINEFINDRQNSYIITNIKIQKLPNN